MIWFWISAVVFIAWLIAWLMGTPEVLLWSLTLVWVATLIIGAMVHKYPPKPVQMPKKQA